MLDPISEKQKSRDRQVIPVSTATIIYDKQDNSSYDESSTFSNVQQTPGIKER